MAVILRWNIPDTSECDFDTTYIYRSSSENGTYSEITNQDISDNTYCDEDGSTSSWYKVRFYDSDTSTFSAYSDPLQGGTHLGYCSISEIRSISSLSTCDISDTDLYNLAKRAIAMLNSDINHKVTREKILYIDRTRENDINGVNATYYVRNWRHHIGDSNNDGQVDTSDITVYQVESDGTETELTVSSITPSEGKFVLSSAPSSGVDLYVDYHWTYVSEETPHTLVQLACEYLATAMAFEKVNRGLSPQQVFGNIRLYRDMKAGNDFYTKYMTVVGQITAESGDYGEQEVF